MRERRAGGTEKNLNSGKRTINTHIWLQLVGTIGWKLVDT